MKHTKYLVSIIITITIIFIREFWGLEGDGNLYLL